MREETRAKRLVKRDADFLSRVNIRFAHIVNDDRRAQQTGTHLAEHVVQQRMAHTLQAFRIAGDQLLGQLARDGDGLLGNQVAILALAFQLDDLVGEVVDTHAVLFAVAYACDLLFQRIIVDRIEVQRADVVLVVFVAVGVELHHRGEHAAKDSHLRRGDKVLELVPQRNVACDHRALLFNTNYRLLSFGGHLSERS